MMEQHTGIENFDFQIVRFTGQFRKKYSEVQQDLAELGRIQDFESWYDWWCQKAEEYEKIGLMEVAMVYYRAALFYLAIADKRKDVMYGKMRSCFEQVYMDLDFQHVQIPYQGDFLPATYIAKEGARKTLLIFGGFDAYLEELVGMFLPLQEEVDYNLLIFDGPGQGVVSHHGPRFHHDYEKAVTAVLDSFQLSEVDALGVSWGGYFVLRAAAFEKRIKTCICFNIFYSSMDALQLQTHPVEFSLLKLALFFKQRRLINTFINLKAKNDLDLAWMVQQGMDITGTESPYDFIVEAKKHTVEPILKQIDQECFLMAGSQDFYVPSWRLADMKSKLTGAKSVETCLFTEQTGGVLHCQIDRPDLGLAAISAYLKKKIA